MFSILTYGLSVAVVGMATVFCGLIILIGFIKGMEKVLPKIAARDFSFKKAAATSKDVYSSSLMRSSYSRTFWTAGNGFGVPCPEPSLS